MQKTQITNKNLIRHTYPTNLALFSRSNFANTLFGAQPPHQTNLKKIFHLKFSFFLFLWEEKPAGKSFFCLFLLYLYATKTFPTSCRPPKVFFFHIYYIHSFIVSAQFFSCMCSSQSSVSHSPNKEKTHLNTYNIE